MEVRRRSRSTTSLRRQIRRACNTRDLRAAFVASFAVGAVLGVVVFKLQDGGAEFEVSPPSTDRRAEGDRPGAYPDWLSTLGLASEPVDPDVGRYQTHNASTDKDVTSQYQDSEAAFLRAKVRVACLVFPTDDVGAFAVDRTWGRHCNQLFLVSHKFENETIPVVKTKAGSEFALLCHTLRKINALEEIFDWVLVATDNTYVLVENFRYYVAAMNSSDTLYLGHAMRFWGQEYNWGQAGYAVSRGTVDLLLKKFQDARACESGGRFWKNGDWYLGKHLAESGVRPVDTRDAEGKGRFNGFTFHKLLFPGGVSMFDRYWRDSLYLSPDGPRCCSNHAVTFHGILSRSKMFQLEYFFYHLRPFYDGGSVGNAKPKFGPKSPFFSWEDKLKDDALKKFVLPTEKPPPMPPPPNFDY